MKKACFFECMPGKQYLKADVRQELSTLNGTNIARALYTKHLAQCLTIET